MVFSKPLFTFARQGFAKVVGGYAQAAKLPAPPHVHLSSTHWQPSSGGSGRDANHGFYYDGSAAYSTSAVASSADDGQNERQWLRNPSTRRPSLSRPLTTRTHSTPESSEIGPVLSYRNQEHLAQVGRSNEELSQLEDPEVLHRLIESSWKDKNYLVTAQAFAKLRDAKQTLRPGQALAVLDSFAALRKGQVQTTKLLLDAFSYITASGIDIPRKCYALVVEACCQRDEEARDMVHGFERKLERDGFLSQSDYATIASLEGERNFDAAVQIVKESPTVNSGKYALPMYNFVLKAAAAHEDADVAVAMYRLLEERRVKPSIKTYGHLMNALSSTKGIEPVLEVYKEVQEKLDNGSLQYPVYPDVYNALIKAYFRASDPEAAVAFIEKLITSVHPKHPHPSTFATVINGFASNGDLETAYTWIDRQLHDPSLPDVCWKTFSRIVSNASRLESGPMASKLYDLFMANRENVTPLEYQVFDYLALVAKEGNLQKAKDVYKAALSHKVALDMALAALYAELLVRHGEHDEAMEVVARGGARFATTDTVFQSFQQPQTSVADALERLIRAIDTAKELTWPRAAKFVDMHRTANLNPHLGAIERLVRFFDEATLSADFFPDGVSDSDLVDATHAIAIFYATYRPSMSVANTLRRFVGYLQSRNIVPRPSIVSSISIAIRKMNDPTFDAEWRHFINNMDAFAQVEVPSAQSPSQKTPPARQSRPSGNEAMMHRELVNMVRRYEPVENWLYLFQALSSHAEHKFEPTFYECMIAEAGRQKDMRAVDEIFNVAMQVMPRYDGEVQEGFRQKVYDSMLIANISIGDLEGAQRFHQLLLSMGRAPSASAFATYIVNLKGTNSTDEASTAVSYFEEARSLGVAPTAFLFNTVISKLSKARRSSEALQYYVMMKASGITPNAVTYGTVINACCRIGDEKHAQELFREMEFCLPNSRPRAAPYNSMMQFYADIQKNREMALHYYDKLLQRGITPTEHTYRLLINAYAAIQPPDFAAVDQVLKTMKENGASITNKHYAAIIHAKGCVAQDLPGAKQLFQQAVREKGVGRDTVLYQALLESMVANNEIAETQELMEEMKQHGVQMTAYMANCLIHGWAKAGDLQKAEAVFNALEPYSGVFGREPCAYEAMARAYLNHGNHAAIGELVSEMESKGYAPPVIAHVQNLTGEVAVA